MRDCWILIYFTSQVITSSYLQVPKSSHESMHGGNRLKLWRVDHSSAKWEVPSVRHKIDHIHPAFIQFGLITGAHPMLFSPHGHKSYSCLLPSTCCPSVSPEGRGALKNPELRRIQPRSWENAGRLPLSPLWYFFTPLTLDLTPPQLCTHTHPTPFPLTWRFTVKSSGWQEVWTVHFLIQTNVALGSWNYHGATRCFRWVASVEC